MGFMDGDETILFSGNEACNNVCGLIQHMKDIMPTPEDLDVDDAVQKISFASVELGKWQLADESACSTTYTMKLTVTIYHESAIPFATTSSIIEAIYENGANLSFTPDAEDALPQTFLYPYHSTIADLDHHLA